MIIYSLESQTHETELSQELANKKLDAAKEEEQRIQGALCSVAVNFSILFITSDVLKCLPYPRTFTLEKPPIFCHSSHCPRLYPLETLPQLPWV